MKTKGRAAARSKRAGADASPSTTHLLSLPVDLLHVVLGMLTRGDLKALLQTSKAMAQQVFQHRSGKLELQIKVTPGKNWVATRHLLQWATAGTARVKLRVWFPDDPTWRLTEQEHETLSTLALDSLLGKCSGVWPMLALKAPLQQQFSSLTHVHLEELLLPWLVPPGMRDTCPNVHTLTLTCCKINVSSSNDSGDSNRGSKGSSKGFLARAVCPSITHLRLHDTWLDVLKLIRGPSTRHQQQLLAAAGQLKRTLPGMSCLDVNSASFTPQLISLWGPQVTELRVQEYTGRLCPEYSALTGRLDQLNALVLVGFILEHVDDLKALLALPCLECLQLDSIYNITEDLSDHPCTWQHLGLHLRDSGLSLLDIANVPLYTLLPPLVLGTPEGKATATVRVLLPDPNVHNLTQLQHLNHQLLKCGVELLAQDMVYEFPYGIEDADAFETAEMGYAAMLSAISQVFHTIGYVTLDSCPDVGKQVVQALGVGHNHRLKGLELRACCTQLQDGAVWATLLSSLPMLEKVELVECWPDDAEEADWIMTLCVNLVSAMAQEPAGRCIEVHFHHDHPSDLIREVIDNHQFNTETVAVAARYAYGHVTDARGYQATAMVLTAARRDTD